MNVSSPDELISQQDSVMLQPKIPDSKLAHFPPKYSKESNLTAPKLTTIENESQYEYTKKMRGRSKD